MFECWRVTDIFKLFYFQSSGLPLSRYGANKKSNYYKLLSKYIYLFLRFTASHGIAIDN